MRYWLGLGANLGDCAGTLRKAVDALAAIGTVVSCSRIYSSAPVGGPPQPMYLNVALVLDADADPPTLLGHTQVIEQALGRDRAEEVRWGPRTIDIDLLLAGDKGELELVLPGLELPHPRLHERAFAMAGVVELSPDLVHPSERRPLQAMLRERMRYDPVAPTGERL